MQIKDSPHSSSITGSVKIPVSDGSGGPVHITLADIQDFMTDEYAPQWFPPTASITPKNGNVAEIGTALPVFADFDVSGTTPRAVSAAGTATGGIAGHMHEGSLNGNVFTETVTRFYQAGSLVVKTSKGNPTNKTASNATTLIADATVNSGIDPDTKTIKVSSVTVSCTITYVYAIYANTAELSTYTKQPLSLGTSMVLDFTKAETNQLKHSFDIPADYTVTGVDIYNSFSKQDEAYALSNFVISTVYHKDAAGNDVEYKRYTRNDGVNMASKLTVKFTR